MKAIQKATPQSTFSITAWRAFDKMLREMMPNIEPEHRYTLGLRWDECIADFIKRAEDIEQAFYNQTQNTRAFRGTDETS